MPNTDLPADTEATEPRPANPGEIAGGTYGTDRAEIARRSEAHVDRDDGDKVNAGKREPALQDEPGARSPAR